MTGISVASAPATRSSAAPRTPRRRTDRAEQRLAQLLFLGPLVVYLILYFGYPVVKSLMMGSQHYTISTFFTGSAPWVGLNNYTEVLSSRLFTRATLNTFLFLIGSIAGQFSLGLALAMFFRRHFPLSKILRALLLLPWLLPLIVSSAIWRWILDADTGVLNQFLTKIGLIDTGIPWLTSTSVALVAVIMVNIWIGIPFNLSILSGGLQEIPGELYEAADLDGASRWQSFWNITWPLLRPVVTVTLVLGVVYTLKVLDIILGLTNMGPANATQTLATQAYQLSFQSFDFGQGAAVSNILILISVVFAAVYLRMNRRAVDE